MLVTHTKRCWSWDQIPRRNLGCKIRDKYLRVKRQGRHWAASASRVWGCLSGVPHQAAMVGPPWLCLPQWAVLRPRCRRLTADCTPQSWAASPYLEETGGSPCPHRIHSNDYIIHWWIVDRNLNTLTFGLDCYNSFTLICFHSCLSTACISHSSQKSPLKM